MVILNEVCMDTKEQNCAGLAQQDVTSTTKQDVTGSTQYNQTSTAHQNRASAAKYTGTTAAQHAHPSKSSSSPAVLSEQQKRSAHVKRIILLCVAVLCGVAYACIPAVQQWIHASFGAMTTLNMADLIAYIQSFGAGAVAVSFLLMILQAIVAPIPAFFITLANAAIWGWWQGALLSWTSSMVGASLCFYIARILGRDVVVRLNSHAAVQQMERFFDRYGANAIVIARLLPFVPFDPVSYFAGLTSVKFWKFFVATGLGQLPATVVYSYAGGQLSGGAQAFMIGLLILFAAAALIAAGKKMYDASHQRA
ncbi:SNARE-like domain protein [Umbribacter vaginalis]|nr:SNARE-like domain protein [Coriobacteriales bacterium DNF00809]